MGNQNKRTAITDFTMELNAGYLLDNSSFLDLYYWHYFDISAALKKEIIENLNSLSPARFNAYIKYVKNEIHEVHGYYDPDECIIEEWIEKFDLKEGDFPFYDNKKVTRILSVTKKDYDSESKKTGEDIRLMQLKFHWYAAHLEYLKMKKFIDELLETEVIKQQSEVPGKKKNDYAFKEYIWFKNGLLFAEGKMNKYYNSTKTSFADGYSAPKVAKEIGYENHEKFILATIKNYSKDNSNADKNIYNSKDKMEKVIKHCKDNNFGIDEYFLSKLPIE